MTKKGRVTWIDSFGAAVVAAAALYDVSPAPRDFSWRSVSEPSEHELIGQQFPHFSMSEVRAPHFADSFRRPRGGSGKALGDYHGEVVVLNLWATWCTGCRIEQPVHTALAKEYRGKGVQVIGAVYQDLRANVERYMDSEADVGYTVLHGGELEIGSLIEVRSLPQTFVIGRDGIARTWFRGVIGEDALRAAIESAIAAGDVPSTNLLGRSESTAVDEVLRVCRADADTSIILRSTLNVRYLTVCRTRMQTESQKRSG